MNKFNTTLEQIEERFAEVTGLTNINFSKYPIKQNDYENQHQKTAVDKQKKNGFIATPIFLVDQMLEMKGVEAFEAGAKKIPAGEEWTDCDLCTGSGQFTIRTMRMFKNKYGIDPIEAKYLEKHHVMVELDPDNQADLVYTFGPNINLYAGDALKIGYALNEDVGVNFWNEEKKEWEHNFYLDRLLKFDEVNSDRELLHLLFNHLDNKKLMAKLFKRLHKKHSK